MKTTIKYTTNQEGWAIERKCRDEGMKKTSDCYWFQTYEGQNGDIVILERE